jgi:hypothetical protein
MVVIAGLFLDVLVQRSTQDDVQFLVAPTNREQRHASFQGTMDQTQRRFITVRIMHRTGPTWLTVVMVRLDIGWTAGQHQAIDSRQNLVCRYAVAERRNNKWHAIRTVPDGSDILLTGHVEWVWRYYPAISRDAN